MDPGTTCRITSAKEAGREQREDLALWAINLGCLLAQILSHSPISEPSVAEREKNMLSHRKMNTGGKFPTLMLTQLSSPLPW